jgi:hypothetical protein
MGMSLPLTTKRVGELGCLPGLFTRNEKGMYRLCKDITSVVDVIFKYRAIYK